MASLNQWQIIGNLGKDVDLRYSADGKPMARGTIAVNDRVKSPSGEWVDAVQWVTFFAHGTSAETLGKYGTKGTPLFMQGPVSLNKWTDDKGEARADLQIQVRTFVLLGSKRDQESGGDGNWDRLQAAKPAAAAAAEDDWA
jgi:single-strand DNA-binding protein